MLYNNFNLSWPRQEGGVELTMIKIHLKLNRTMGPNLMLMEVAILMEIMVFRMKIQIVFNLFRPMEMQQFRFGACICNLTIEHIAENIFLIF